MSTLRIWLTGINGDVLELGEYSGTYRRLQGARGFGIPPTQLDLVEGAGDGARFRFSRKGPRDLDLPLLIVGNSRAEVHAAQRRLSNVLRDRPGQAPAKLSFIAGSGAEYTIDVHYVAGAETQIGESGSETHTRWLLTLRCPDPFWTARDASSIPPLRVSSGRRLRPKLGNLRVNSSQVLGNVLIENPGDVDAHLTWVLTGPATSFSATRQDGKAFVLGVIVGGETITLDTKTGKVTDQTGANRYALLGSAPKLFTLPGGSSIVAVTMVGATTASLVQAFYRPRLEVMY